MKELYEAIATRLLDEVEEIACVDIEQGQLSALDENNRPVLPLPCALIDIAYTNCEDQGGDMQLVKARIVVRLAFPVQQPTDSLSVDRRREAALAYMDTVDEVYKALQGYDSDNFSPLSRISMTPDNRYRGIKVMNLTFETTFVDETATS